MLPSLLAREVIEGLKGFVITGFETNTPFFRGIFSKFVETPGRFYKGPYLSLSLPFRPGTVDTGFFPEFSTPFEPYAHQEQAWRRLRSDGDFRSTLVAAGTGSGKTECFMFPLLDHCLRHPEPGIKAIVIYPMNALANDQAKRFAETIYDSTDLNGKVRVGLFVGQGERSPHVAMSRESAITDKAAQREQPPDILLTNYKMLDFLLMRPKDQPLWRFNSPKTLRYLVVDELHTFDGAQGTDLACLIRRLKARLGTPPNHLIAIGTSATLGSGEEGEALSRYARRIFQELFDPSCIIHESRMGAADYLADGLIEYQFFPPADLHDRLDPDRYRTEADFIAAQYRLFFPEQPPARPQDPGGDGFDRVLSISAAVLA